MSENIEYIKNFNIGDRVKSNTSILLNRGFRDCCGTIKSIVKDEAGSWQYLIDLDDGRELQCDDCHLEIDSELNDNQKIVLEWLKENKMDNLFLTTARLHRGSLCGGVTTRVKSACGALDSQQQAQVLKAFAEWGLEQWQTTDTGE